MSKTTAQQKPYGYGTFEIATGKFGGFYTTKSQATRSVNRHNAYVADGYAAELKEVRPITTHEELVALANRRAEDPRSDA